MEDDADTANVFSKLLVMNGYHVCIAAGFRAALSLADRECFDLLICDIGLPDGSGLELMKTLSEMYKMRGSAVSGYGELKMIENCRAAGFSEYIVKPATFEKINDAIQKCIPPAPVTQAAAFGVYE